MTKIDILNRIHGYCLDCSDDSASAVAACEALTCDLWPYRMGEVIAESVAKNEAVEAVKATCVICEDLGGGCLENLCELYQIA